MQKSVTLWAIGFAAIVSCNPPVDPSDGAREDLTQGIVVTTGRSSYAATGEVEVTISNHTAEDVRFSLCPGTLEQNRGGDWIRSEQLMLCADHAELLRAGTSRTEVSRLPAGIEPGEHRLVVHLFAADQPVSFPAPSDAVSNTFVVTD